MDKKRGLINVVVSIFFYLIVTIISFFTRRVLIQELGIGVSGLNSLYLSIIGFLSVAELGVGTAITFSMYEPIVKGENDKVAGLYNLFKKLYMYIGIVILLCGIILIPFLKYFAKDYTELSVNIYFSFFLMLISTVITYIYSAKTSLINAYKDNYITTSITSISKIICQIAQIVSLIVFKSFTIYLLCRIFAGLVEWVFIDLFCKKTRNYIIRNNSKIDKDTKKVISKNIKAMFMHKIGTLLVNTADSVIISSFIGVVILGKYSNYSTIMAAMIGVLGMFFSPLTSVIGHMCKESSIETIKKYFNFIYVFSFAIGTFFFLGYYAVIDELIVMCFGTNLGLSKTVSFVITLNYFIQFMRKDVCLFKDATGCFYYDRYKPLFEGILNIVLSILLVLVLPEEYNVVGVIIATIITNILICHVVEPHVLFKYEFRLSAKKYYAKNYLYIILFSVCLLILSKLMITTDKIFMELLINGFISVAISTITIILVFILEKEFRYYATINLKQIIKKVRILIGHKKSQ